MNCGSDRSGRAVDKNLCHFKKHLLEPQLPPASDSGMIYGPAAIEGDSCSGSGRWQGGLKAGTGFREPGAAQHRFLCVSASCNAPWKSPPLPSPRAERVEALAFSSGQPWFCETWGVSWVGNVFRHALCFIPRCLCSLVLTCCFGEHTPRLLALLAASLCSSHTSLSGKNLFFL